MYNKVIMIGNLTRDIELKYLPSGSAIANGAIATSHKYKMQSGEQKEEVCFLDFSVFGKQGEVLNQYVRKGSKVMLEGRLILEQWNDQASGAKRSRHTLRVENFKFLDSKADSVGGSAQGGGYNAPQQQQQQQPAYNQAPQQQYNQQPQQNSYNQPQNGGMQQKPAQNTYEQNIPTIDIDNDEIPF
jgi:single-strand DNA-binding protein